MESKILEVFDSLNYVNIALQEKDYFQSKKPFKHAVIDNFLPIKFARLISDSYPHANSNNLNWKFHNNENTERYLLEDTTLFGSALKAFSAALCSRSFLLFLETLTGIKSLQSDPYFMGGGAMSTGRNGFLNHMLTIITTRKSNPGGA